MALNFADVLELGFDSLEPMTSQNPIKLYRKE